MPITQDKAALERRRMQNRMAQRRRRQRRAARDLERQLDPISGASRAMSEDSIRLGPVPQGPPMCSESMPPTGVTLSQDDLRQTDSHELSLDMVLFDSDFPNELGDLSTSTAGHLSATTSALATTANAPAMTPSRPVTSGSCTSRSSTDNSLALQPSCSIYDGARGVLTPLDDGRPAGIICSAPPTSQRNTRRSRKVLHVCAERGNVKLVELLLRNGADIDAIDSFGRTALHHATRALQKTTVMKLLELGAETEIWDCNGESPLHIAIEAGSEDLVLALIEEGADINASAEY